MLHTTFNLAKQANACDTSKMRAALGEDWADDAPIPLTLVIEHSGIADAIWALRCTVEPSERLARLFACDCAERVLDLFERQFPDDARPRQAIETARRFAMGEASAEELARAAEAARADVARAAASAAAWSAAWSARVAAWEAAWSAARAARKDERNWQAHRLREMLEAHGAEAGVIA